MRLKRWVSICPKKKLSTIRRMAPVCCEESALVDSTAMTPSHRVAGSQSRRICFQELLSERKDFCPRVGRVWDAPRAPCAALFIQDFRLLQVIVRRLAGDDDVVNVALAQAGAADADKARLLLQFGNAGAADVTHPRAQAADELLRHHRKRTAIGNPTFNSFRNKLS